MDAPPPAKKKKTSALPKTLEPIVFQLPGSKPDVCLRVFFQDFHVHSSVLKMYSAFFRKFLDSPDKDNTRTASATGLDYQWATTVDNDGTWQLTAASTTVSDPVNITKFKTSQKAESQVFENILSALYSRSYIIRSLAQLTKMVTLGDYYCLLPSLSRSLDSALLKSPEFCQQIHEHPCELLEFATKLRSALLFREALIYAVGPYNSPKYEQHGALKTREIKLIARATHGDISARVSEINGCLIRWLRCCNPANPETRQKLVHSIITQPLKLWNPTEFAGVWRIEKTSFPEYFRQLSQRKADLRIESNLEEILKNNLVLGRNEIVAGTGAFKDYFLCASIEDEDLPWDLTEIDW